MGPRIAYRGKKIPDVQEYKRCNNYSENRAIAFRLNNDPEKIRQRITSRQMLSSQPLKSKIETELQKELDLTKAELARSQARISAMESSKFWKLRATWFKLKKLLKIEKSN